MARTTWHDLLYPGEATDFFARQRFEPFDPGADGYAPTNALWLAELCRLVYRHDDVEAGPKPDPSRVSFLEKVGLRERRSFRGESDKFRARAMLIESTSGAAFAVLAFRGTEQNPKDFRTDICDGIFKIPHSDEPRHHGGFESALNLVWPEIAAALDELRLEKPACAIFYTGHSLGAALATLAAARHEAHAVYTFGSPRVGNAAFGALLERKGVVIHRVVDALDIITAVPLENAGYVHVGTLHTLAVPRSERFNGSPPRRLADHAPVNYVDRAAPIRPKAIDDWEQREAERIARRRSGLWPASKSNQVENWGLALSGGGIRSATFSLGVLQALARCRLHVQNRPAERGRDPALLKQFDYLSTVSGGGYIGAFLCSLFIPGRLSNAPDETARVAADRALEVLEEDPPTRLNFAALTRQTELAKAPLAWLRENGRYLSPTGAGDTLYAAGLAIRNWASIQYVIGTALVLMFVVLALLRQGGYAAVPMLPPIPEPFRGVNPLAAIPLLVMFLGTAPIGIAFWFAYGPGKQSEETNATLGIAFWVSAAMAFVFVALARWAWHADDRSLWITCAFIAAQLAAACIWYAATRPWHQTIIYERVLLTRWFKNALIATVVLALLVAADSLVTFIYEEITEGIGGVGSTLSSAAVVSALIWIVRFVAQQMEKPEKESWLAKVPLNILAAILAFVLFAVIAVLWGLLVRAVECGHFAECTYLFAYEPQFDAQRFKALAMFLAGIIVLTLAAGGFPAFVNLSTFQSLYGARLTRAYLGASNGQRFTGGAAEPTSSVAEPIPGDQLTHPEYYGIEGGRALAPLHIINITMNQTIADASEQLVQRDRKGRPFAVLPQGFSIDGYNYSFAHPIRRSGSSMTIGQWIGTSGAAVSTGLGRATSVGFSFLLGMSNVRLGVWWRSGVREQAGDRPTRPTLGSLSAALPTQWLLFWEFTAQFYGLRRPWQYLTDGGHFENTGLYELLRPARQLRLIVASDNGRDSGYQFDDLANLIRLARIDFGLEIEVDTNAPNAPGLVGVFGTPAMLADPSRRDGICAMLLNVRNAEPPGTTPQRSGGPQRGNDSIICRIVLLKPRVIDGLPIDVMEYSSTHADFPQESTGQQFFNEAQWESYRKLGMTIAERVFGGANGRALMTYLGL